MKRYIPIIAATFLALVSCSKEADTSHTAEYFEQGETVVLAVKADDTATRVSSELGSDGKNIDFNWQSGDKILVTVGGSTAQFTLTGGAGTTSAIFEGKMPAAGSTFNVQYPCQTPELASQTYSGTEALPHDKMLFTATNCSTTDAVVSLQCQYAALRLNLYGTDQTIGKIVVTNTTSGTSSYTLDCGDGATIGSTEAAATSFFIVVNPEGTDWNFSAKIFDNASTPASICSFKTTTAKTFTKGEVLNMPKKVVEKNYALSGDFTVNSDGDKVNFSCGNLYYDGSAFKFETTQYSSHSNVPSSTSPLTSLFRWATNSGDSDSNLTSDIEKALGTGQELSGTSKDVIFTNATQTTPRAKFTVEGQQGKWRTLSSSEWDHLLNKRSGVVIGKNNGCRYAEVSVNSRYGLLIFPDVFTWPSNVDNKKQPSTYNNYHTYWNSINYSDEEFSNLEDAGCVFLPVAGYRYTTTLYGVDDYGYYWTSTVHASNPMYYAYQLLFDYNHVNCKCDNRTRYAGLSIRLVRKAE